jgi:hypothetical protein
MSDNQFVKDSIPWSLYIDIKSNELWKFEKNALWGRYVIHICVHTHIHIHTTVYPKVSGLVAWSENCKWYSSLPLGAVVSLFCE